MRRLCHLLVLLACLGIVSCSASQTGDEAAPEPFEPLISQKDIEAEAEGSPERALLELWYYGQVGSMPNVVRFYDARVRRKIGDDQIAGTYDMQRTHLMASRLTRVTSEETAAGTLVTAEVTSTLRDGKPIPSTQRLDKGIESFLMRRRDGEWRVVYDTFLENGLPTYIQTIRGPFSDEQERELNQATREGRSFARAYRVLYSQRIDRRADDEE